ncbi:hypothetical protein G210_0971 [Candida maltosa Xu316]|uniref:Uncharacterized protein n=1 Tax=Candida maltosa (strain Xu316) TaxID=1245528 RepID=M3IWQ1_CANMX|nr:hypothetical protein G210_0971 [Candida maltosa Xu316]
MSQFNRFVRPGSYNPFWGIGTFFLVGSAYIVGRKTAEHHNACRCPDCLRNGPQYKRNWGPREKQVYDEDTFKKEEFIVPDSC